MLVPPFRCMCLNPIYVGRYVRNIYIYIYIINEFVNFKLNLTTYKVQINIIKIKRLANSAKFYRLFTSAIQRVCINLRCILGDLTYFMKFIMFY